LDLAKNEGTKKVHAQNITRPKKSYIAVVPGSLPDIDLPDPIGECS
jgi:hypothetical protein